MVHLITSIILPHFNMKTFSGSARLFRHLPMTRKGLCLVLAIGTIIFAAGCGKKDAASTPPPPATTTVTQTAASPETPAAATAAPAAAPEPANAGPVPPAPTMEPVTAAPNNGMSFLQQLNRASITFKMQNRRNPSTPEELAAFAGVQLPPPPAGKNYAMNPKGYIVLVDAAKK